MDIRQLLFSQNFLYEEQKLLTARILAENVKNKGCIASFEDVEFKVFSQWGDDGIIQWLISHLDIPNKTFVEFGVENYRESNTRFLMMNNNWSGLVMDGSPDNVNQITNSEYFWKYDLQAKAAFVDCSNVNELIASRSFDPEIGILHIDIDGNDYWIWETVDVVNPVIAIIEYNSVFGCEQAITIPYNKQFVRTAAHFSNLYYGASLPALCHLALKKGYAFIGCSSVGNNAYFVRRDKLNDVVREISAAEGYVASKFRESRDQNGRLTYAAGADRIKLIKGLPVVDVISNKKIML